MKTLISVIIPTYQRCDKLKVTLESVLSQTYKNFEVLIIDDGSSDGTKEMVQSFNDSRIFYFWQRNTGGPANPRNNGIKEAKGNWIAFLDDDDVWRENKLSEIYKEINDKIDFIYHNFSSVVHSKFPKKKLIKSSNLIKPKLIDLLINGNKIGVSTVVVRKKLLLSVNGFNEDVNMAPCADYNTWLKIAQKTEKFLYLPKNLGYYNIDEYNMSNQDMTISKKLAIKEFLYLLTHKQRIKLQAKLSYQSGNFNFTKKNYVKALNLFCRAFMNGKVDIRIKSLVRLFQVSILRVLDKIINKV